VKCQGAADRLKIIEGDALKVMNNLEPNSFDRILAPRPKEGAMDGDQGQGDGGLTFLRALLPLLKNQGECHWYDFASDSELPQCERTRASIKKACDEIGVGFEVIAITRCGSIAKRQMRICMDFRVIKE
jgi:tRNA G37 N-methylase Trm5